MPPRKRMKDIADRLKADNAAKEEKRDKAVAAREARDAERLAKAAPAREAREAERLAKAASAREAREAERLAKAAAAREAREAERLAKDAADKEANEAERLAKEAERLAQKVGDIIVDIQSAASTPVDENCEETMLPRALEGAKNAQAKEQQEKEQKDGEASELKLQKEKEEADAKRLVDPKAPVDNSWGTTPENGAAGVAPPASPTGTAPPKGTTGAARLNARKGNIDDTVEESNGPDDAAGVLEDATGTENARALQEKQLAERSVEGDEAKKKLEDERAAKMQEVIAKEKAQRELTEKQASEKASREEAKKTKEEAEKKRRQSAEAEKEQKEQVVERARDLVEKNKAQEQRETRARLKTEEAAEAAENERKNKEEEEEEADEIEKVKAKELEEQTRRARQEQRDIEAKKRNRILSSIPITTSVSPQPRSPSLESISSLTSAFSSNDDLGTMSSSPNISVQGASQDGDINFWTQGAQEGSLYEGERIKRASPRDEEQLKSVEASQALTDSDAYPMHKRFCFPTENIYFLVEGVLYSVHRYFFERDSSSFVGQGLSKQEPMVLANVSTYDFDLFLSILYPISFGVYPASTVEEWSGILYLADKWSFLSVRMLAIVQIAPIASPIDKIVFGRLYGVNEWLASAYHAVCTRPNTLTLEEGRRLGVDDVIRINAIRQEFCFVRVSDSSSKLSEDDVKSRFGFAVQTEHSDGRKSMKDVADRLKPDRAAEATSKKEEVARAADIQRKKRQQEAADKDLEDKKARAQRETDAKAADIKREKREQEAADKAKLEEEEVAKATENERNKREQQRADKKAQELEDRQREAEVRKLKDEATKASENERKKREQQVADEKATELEDRQCEAEMKLKEEAAKATENERKKREQEAADKKAKELEDRRREAEVKSKEADKAAEIERKQVEQQQHADKKANEEEDWSRLTPDLRYYKKLVKAQKEKANEERAESVKRMKQQLADEAKTAEEGATQQDAGGTSDVLVDGTSSSISIMEPNGMSGISNTSMGTAANKDWSHLTPSQRYWQKLAKFGKEMLDENAAEQAERDARSSRSR
ncbi:hypothetical protein FIBSPDRAFT_1055082 [Athelia psychrophila]|uniref:BTB domain-containing protein n=1 Tax=Athelia psychrophila TaxID=1759441 RepID=A0A167UCC7_9AGAM|nr:hypothetical protein FIBSPDRAFT_1055082 [Fibularhizoctonia sp. CBS 109695]